MTESSRIPADVRYTKDHEWVRLEGDAATVGITDHAQKALGEITYVEMPPIGKAVHASDELAAVESSKAASDILAPVGGTVAEVNALLEETPETINSSPYDEGWICKLHQINIADADALMTAAEYQEFLVLEDK